MPNCILGDVGSNPTTSIIHIYVGGKSTLYIKITISKGDYYTMENILMMCCDTPVLSFNFDIGEPVIFREDLLPWILKRRLNEIPKDLDMNTKYGRTRLMSIMNKNNSAIISWLSGRVLSLSRRNAKWLYNLLHLNQVEDEVSKAKVSIKCRSVSVLDNYWIKLESSKDLWVDKNIRHVSLNEVIAQVALHGESLTLQGSLSTPELTTNGSYAKAWRRHNDSRLWLYKLGDKGSTESKIEVMVSNLLNKMPVKHCYYKAGTDKDKYVCMCPCMSNDNISIVSAMDFDIYCNTNDLNFEQEVMKLDSDSMYKMFIVDYLISNRDRHSQNWGMYYYSDTMEIVGCHPLFDHNNAFDIEYINNPDSEYQFGNKNIRQTAKHAMSKVDFFFTEEITRDDFLTDRQYESFMWRAKDLGVKVKPYRTTLPKDYVRKIVHYNSYYNLYLDVQKTLDVIPSVVLEDDDLLPLLFSMSPIQEGETIYERR